MPTVSLPLRFGGALLLLGLVAWLVGPARLQQQLAAVTPVWFVLAVALAAAAQLISALRWAVIARVLGLKAPTSSFVGAYARGITLNVLLPGATIGGDTLRSLMLKRHGNPLDASVLSVLLDRLSGLWMLCVMSTLALAVFAMGGRLPTTLQVLMWPYLLGLIAAVALPLLPWRVPKTGAAAQARVVASTADPKRMATINTREGGDAAAMSVLKATWVSRAMAALARMHALLLARRAPLLRSLWGSVLVQLFSAAALWASLRAAGGDAGFLAVLAVAAPVFIAAALPISIGGFGAREAVAAFAFPLTGVSAEQGVAAALLYGLTAVVLGIVAAPLFALPSAPAR